MVLGGPVCFDEVPFMYTMSGLCLVMQEHYVMLHVHLRSTINMVLSWG